MRLLTLCAALGVCLVVPTSVFAQDDTVPMPPPREHDVGADVLEQGPKVTAEEPEPAKPEPEEPAITAEPVAPEPEPAEPEKPAITAEPVEEPVTAVEVAPDMETGKTLVEKDLQAAEEPVAPPDVDTLKATPDADRPAEMQAPAARPVASTMNEVELAERVAVAREAYRLALQALKGHYVDTHDTIKLQWAEKELAELIGIDKYHYLSEVELAGPDLKPIASVSAADLLFREGIEFKDYPAFPREKRGKLKTALQKFRTIIADYPTSDKIDDAAFRMGEIYEGWYHQDYARAVVCYERCFQWNPRTQHPARFNAARLYDQKLMMRDKAVRLYNLVVQESQNTQHVDEAMRRLKELSARP